MIRLDAEPGLLAVYGAGDHGRVVAEAATASGWSVLGFLDDAPTAQGELPWPLLDWDDPQLREAAFIVGVGDNAARRRCLGRLKQAERRLANVIHPRAAVSPSVQLQPTAGVFVGPCAVVHSGAELHSGAIVNSGAIVEHNCRIGACAHVAPGAALGGNVSIGAESLVGLNATILPRCRVGSRCTVGAGAVVTRSVDEGLVVVGAPARPIK